MLDRFDLGTDDRFDLGMGDRHAPEYPLVHRIPEKRSIKAQFWTENWTELHLYCFKATMTNVEVVKPLALR
jgi:hypothetical protein